MIATILTEMPTALIWAVIGAVVFALLGLVSGTDETATITPITLLVVLLGVPPSGIFAFFIAAVVSKHMTHAVPTMLLGIPGDTMAIPLLREADLLRRLGVPHIALKKAISGAVIAALIAVPIAVAIAGVLAPISDTVKAIAPWLFLIITAVIAYLTPAKIGGIVSLVPFIMLFLGLQKFTGAYEVKLTISYFLGIAVGPLIIDLLAILSPLGRRAARRSQPETYHLATIENQRQAMFPHPLNVLDRTQKRSVLGASVISSLVFVFSPVAMTVMMGELFRKTTRQAYHRLTTMVTVKNATTESTYIAETLIPLVAFGLPLSPMAVGPAQPLFNAPPRFTVDSDTGEVTNLHTLMNAGEFLVFGVLGVIVAALITYPLVMKYAHTAARVITQYVSQEAIISAFVALVLIISVWEGGLLGPLVVLSVGAVGGLLIRFMRIHAGVLFMGYYVAVLSVPAIIALVS